MRWKTPSKSKNMFKVRTVILYCFLSESVQKISIHSPPKKHHIRKHTSQVAKNPRRQPSAAKCEPLGFHREARRLSGNVLRNVDGPLLPMQNVQVTSAREEVGPNLGSGERISPAGLRRAPVSCEEWTLWKSNPIF